MTINNLKRPHERRLLLVLAMLAVVLASAARADAQAPASAAVAKEGPNLVAPKDDQPGPPGDLEVLALAYDLHASGMAQGDALTVIAAARLAARIPLTEREPREGAGPRGSQAGDAGRMPPDLDSMIQDARTLAEDDKALLAIIDDIAATRTKGPVVGRVKDYAVALPRQSLVIFNDQITRFKGGELAEVMIGGDGTADLDLYVFDELGNQICASESRGPNEHCRWTPRWTGPFRIEVRNLGQVSSRFALAMQ